MATEEELKEIIVKLNVSLLHLNDTAEALKKENKNLSEQVAELSVQSRTPAPKPKYLGDSEYDYVIEKVLGKHLPPDQSLALSRDEVFKIEDEFRLCVDAVSDYESNNVRLSKAIAEQENDTERYKRLFNNEHNRALCLEGSLEERIKECDELRNKIATLEYDLAECRANVDGTKE